MTILDFYLYDDHEPWSLGDAEIYVKLLDGWTFGAGTYVAKKWFDLPEDVGNLAPPGPVQNVRWEDKGF